MVLGMPHCAQLGQIFTSGPLLRVQPAFCSITHCSRAHCRKLTCTSSIMHFSYNTAEILNSLVLAVTHSASAGRMAASKVGSDNVMGSGSALNERRTSSSLLLDITVTLQHAALRKLIKAAQDAAWMLTGRLQAHVYILVWLGRLDLAVTLLHAHCWEAEQ